MAKGKQKKNPYDVQVGGEHYNKKHDIFQLAVENEVGAGEYTAMNYVYRHRAKGGIEDLKKAKHCIDMLAYSVYGELI